jgi:hypothetical protein
MWPIAIAIVPLVAAELFGRRVHCERDTGLQESMVAAEDRVEHRMVFDLLRHSSQHIARQQQQHTQQHLMHDVLDAGTVQVHNRVEKPALN